MLFAESRIFIHRRRLSEHLAKLDASIARFEERLATSAIPRIATAK